MQRIEGSAESLGLRDRLAGRVLRGGKPTMLVVPANNRPAEMVPAGLLPEMATAARAHRPCRATPAHRLWTHVSSRSETSCRRPRSPAPQESATCCLRSAPFPGRARDHSTQRVARWTALAIDDHLELDTGMALVMPWVAQLATGFHRTASRQPHWVRSTVCRPRPADRSDIIRFPAPPLRRIVQALIRPCRPATAPPPPIACR